MPSWRGLEVAQVGAEPVDAAVEAPHLGVEGVHEPPEQALAFVGHLEAIRSDALGQDAERFAHRGAGVVFVPDLAGVELVALGLRAEELRVLADRRGHGLVLGVDAVDIGHDVLLNGSDEPSGPVRRTLPTCAYWFTRAQGSHRGRRAWPVGVREWCGRRERSD